MLLVDLFGKKKLEDRILELQAALAKLEGEKEELLRTLEKREEKMQREQMLAFRLLLKPGLPPGWRLRDDGSSHPASQECAKGPLFRPRA